ncbi:MAG: SLC13 family permease [Lachnospiraceae bacterium]|jgi:Na+/H+ antiporter NhaD/arsenite permease-like protein
MKIFALIVFIAVYAVMILNQKYRVYAAAAGAILFLAVGVAPVKEFFTIVDFNVLMMIAGMMITVSYFSASNMPMKMADAIMDRSKNICTVTILLSVFAGVISAFIDNVATVLMVAPVAIAIAKKQKVSPVPMIISIAVSSNLQGAATLVGDTTSIMLGAYADMNFMDFIFMDGKPGIFWSVELGAAMTIPVMMILFRNMKQPVEAQERTEVKDYLPSFFLAATVITLILASFLPSRPKLTNGIICMVYAGCCVVSDLIRTRKSDGIRRALKELDYETIILLASLFIVVDGIREVGIISDISRFFVRFGGNNLFLLYTLIVWGSVAISAFIDNIPYVSTMLPVIQGISELMGIEPYLLYFGLLCGATLGGNLTPIGASANITGVGILRKNGYPTSNKDFCRISIPFTLTAVTAGYLFLWFVWG